MRERKGMGPATCPDCKAERQFRVLYPDRLKRRQTAECLECGYRWLSKHPEVWDVAMEAVRRAGEDARRIASAEIDGSFQLVPA